MEVSVGCPYCDHDNTIDFEDYGLDLSQLGPDGVFENLYDRCSGCQESYTFDVCVNFVAKAF